MLLFQYGPGGLFILWACLFSALLSICFLSGCFDVKRYYC